MIIAFYIKQLENKYGTYLKDIVNNVSYEPIVLRGGKTKPSNYAALSAAITEFQQHEKQINKLGWTIEWETTHSKKISLGAAQLWPKTITVTTVEDFLYLIKKQKEVDAFTEQVQQLLSWKPNIQDWLVKNTPKVLANAADWLNIQLVVDYILENDVSTFYKRNLPIPIHSKFIENNEAIIKSLLCYLNPEKYDASIDKIEVLIGVKQKPLILPLRWLDNELAAKYAYEMEIIGITHSGLQQLDWQVAEIWLVENETALYMLPHRQNALAICTMGKYVAALSDILLFNKSKLFYWGDIDQEGFRILASIRNNYAHIISVLMDIASLQHLHNRVLEKKYETQLQLDNLTIQEADTLRYIESKNIWLEQENIDMKYVQDTIDII